MAAPLPLLTAHETLQLSSFLTHVDALDIAELTVPTSNRALEQATRALIGGPLPPPTGWGSIDVQDALRDAEATRLRREAEERDAVTAGEISDNTKLLIRTAIANSPPAEATNSSSSASAIAEKALDATTAATEKVLESPATLPLVAAAAVAVGVASA